MTAISSPPMRAWPRKVDGRTGQPVRRDSHPYEAGAAWFQPTTKRAVTRIMRGAERLEKLCRRRRAKGRHWGAELRPMDLHILEALLFQAMDWATGKLDWSYDQIQAATGRSRQAIADALFRLDRLGIVKRLRRFIRTEAAGAGPQVQQATNAYRVDLPARLAALVGMGPDREPPPPDDHAHAVLQARMANDVAEAAHTGRATLGTALAKLGAAVDARESGK